MTSSRKIVVSHTQEETHLDLLEAEYAALEWVRKNGSAVLLFQQCRQKSISIGRYFFTSASLCKKLWASGSVERSLRGGRCHGVSPGHLGLSLIVPHSSWLQTEGSPMPLQPERLLNRFIRPISQAFHRLGVGAFFPGREVLVVRGHWVALLSFIESDDGIVLCNAWMPFEEPLAGGIDRELGQLLGLSPAMSGPTIGDLATVHVKQDQWINHLVEGIVEMLGAQSSAQIPAEITSRAPQITQKLESREWFLHRHLDCVGGRWLSFEGQMGSCQIHIVESEGGIDSFRLFGPIFSNDEVLARLSSSIAGTQPNWHQLASTIDRTLSRRRSYLIGIGKTRQIPDIVCAALKDSK